MTLAPIRGAPPGAPNPPFPIEEPEREPIQPTLARISEEKVQLPPSRQRGTPIEIHAPGTVLIFSVIPEQPAIARASMTIHIADNSADRCSSQSLGFLRMSDAKAREFLTGMRDGRSPMVATGDEEGTVQIDYETTQSGSTFSVFKLGDP